MKKTYFLLISLICTFSLYAYADETADSWFKQGQKTLEKSIAQKPNKQKAKNAIIFIGDGMGISTVTAARILQGQQKGKTGEENFLSWENFPYTALSKTYNTNLQTPDSAGTMSAMMTGSKTKAGFISVDQSVARGQAKFTNKQKLFTLFERAEIAGKATGIVTTARLTHATPASCYAHTSDRNWENDTNLPQGASVEDIAAQLIAFGHNGIGNGLEVALGGGRRNFFPQGEISAVFSKNGDKGKRKDKRNLVQEWLKKYPNAAYAHDKKSLQSIDPKKTKHLLGLFNKSHLKYDLDRVKEKSTEPSLADMSIKALDMLDSYKEGYVLMIEAGRIDHGHHAGNAARALQDTVAFSDAVEAVMKRINTDETIVLLTADHSHVFTMAGYPSRGNDILGLVRSVDKHGNPQDKLATDAIGKPYTTLGYANGPGYLGASMKNKKEVDQAQGHKHYPHRPNAFIPSTGGRPTLTDEEVGCDHLQESTIPMSSETHGGEDVGIWAIGPRAHYLRGTLEQNVIFHLLNHALGLEKIKNPFIK